MDTGLAALLAAIELIDGSWKTGAMDVFLTHLESVAGYNCSSDNILECKSRLRETCIQGGFYNHKAPCKDRVEGGISPVCVSNIPASQDPC